MIGWNFTRCCKSPGMCLPWHALLLPSAELQASLQVSIQANLVHWIIYYPWEGALVGWFRSGLWHWAREAGEWELYCSTLAELGANQHILLRCPLGVALDLFLQDCYILVCGMGGVGGNFWGKYILSKVICTEVSVLFCSLAFGGVVGKFQCERFCLKINAFPRQGLLQICRVSRPQHMLVKPWWCSLAELSDGLLHVFVCTSCHLCGGGRGFSPA